MKDYKSLTVFFSSVWVLISAMLYIFAGVHRLELYREESSCISKGDPFSLAVVAIVGLLLIPLLNVILYFAQKAEMTMYVRIVKLVRFLFVIAFAVAFFSIVINAFL